MSDTDWHQCVVEWTPEGIRTWIDGVEIERPKTHIPTPRMEFTMQGDPRYWPKLNNDSDSRKP